MGMKKFTTIGKATKEIGVSYLGGVNLSAKMVKNVKIGVMTYSLNLSPASTSGYNVCLHSTPECRLGCLATSGHAKMDIISGKGIINRARVIKTKLFFEDQTYFMNWLIADIKKFQKQAEKENMVFSVRLNTISDIDWANVIFDGKVAKMNIFELFPMVQFYDYTKNVNKFVNKPENYHLTFSYTGRNWTSCEQLLERGNNIAMVFNVKHETELPAMYKGYTVVNGDETDYRPNDGNGVIVGLKWKRIADKDAETKILGSIFVVQPTDKDCTYNNLIDA